jgi:hypothetical protein
MLATSDAALPARLAYREVMEYRLNHSALTLEFRRRPGTVRIGASRSQNRSIEGWNARPPTA